MTIRYKSPHEAESAFYRAFEQNDFAGMVSVWDGTDDVVCVHPMSSALLGARAVAEGWREIFAGEVAMRFGIEEIRISRLGSLAIHIVKEHIEVPGGGPVAPMTATNIYRETADGWRMILHHASPSPSVSPGGSGEGSGPVMH
jgi:ketosteroid isomerase-like protein